MILFTTTLFSLRSYIAVALNDMRERMDMLENTKVGDARTNKGWRHWNRQRLEALEQTVNRNHQEVLTNNGIFFFVISLGPVG